MAEFTNAYVQSVAPNANVVFTEEPVSGKGCIVHREGSGLITLRGMTNQCRALFRVTFGGNIAIPTGGTVGEISIAITIDGEPVPSATATVTPAAVENFFNVFSSVFIEVPKGCCVTVSVRNVNTQAIEVENANIIVERAA